MMHIAKATLKEATKKKILILIGIITLLYLALLVTVMYFVSREAGNGYRGGEKEAFDYLMEISVQITSIIGFYFSAMLVAFMTILLSTGAVSAEIESGVLQGIIAKPITRRDYYVGKYLGYAAIVIAFSTFLYASILVISILFDMPFMELANFASIIGGWLQFVLEPLAILAVSLLLGISLKSIAGAILVGGIFVFSMIGGFLGQIGGITENATLKIIGTASVFAAPFDALYKRMTEVFFAPTDTIDVLTMIGDVSGSAQGPWVSWYALAYIAMMLALGIWRFSKKDL